MHWGNIYIEFVPKIIELFKNNKTDHFWDKYLVLFQNIFILRRYKFAWSNDFSMFFWGMPLRMLVSLLDVWNNIITLFWHKNKLLCCTIHLNRWICYHVITFYLHA